MLPYCKGNGLDLDDLVQEGMIGLYKAKVNIKSNKEGFNFLIAGTLNEIKGQLIAIKAIENLIKNTNYNLFLYIVNLCKQT